MEKPESRTAPPILRPPLLHQGSSRSSMCSESSSEPSVSSPGSLDTRSGLEMLRRRWRTEALARAYAADRRAARIRKQPQQQRRWRGVEDDGDSSDGSDGSDHSDADGVDLFSFTTCCACAVVATCFALWAALVFSGLLYGLMYAQNATTTDLWNELDVVREKHQKLFGPGSERNEL